MYQYFNFYKLIPLVLFLITTNLSADYTIQAIGARNGGEFNFETGNRFPNLSGVRGGSRISFERNYNLFGLGGRYSNNRFEIYGKFTTTGWYVPTGRARDEDFFLFATSQEKAHHLMINETTYYDSVNVYSGTRNFADGIGKSSMSEYNIDLLARYYFGDARSDLNKSGDGFYLSGGLRYTYNKFIFYDVVQWVASNPIFYGPIGYGLSFTNSILQIPFGFGYRLNGEKFYLDSTFHFMIVYDKTRDFHAQRNINFNSLTAGPGILAQLELGYKFNPKMSFFTRMNQMRYFTKGSFEAVGGLTQEDIAANFLGRYKAHINAKEYRIEFGVDYRPDWGNPSLETPKVIERRNAEEFNTNTGEEERNGGQEEDPSFSPR
ncbi:putative porin [Leptospira sp. GIMC2001]|uniref:putative porin n=1 Tax=Leptospira sp. GIMC2001 TaxID=1513297 RepID=UPI00234933F8|nr:putative porin [Leptospira sp. GIMC2001]WCL47707.1 putative porin [Leptospira sp. GIMC2001]